MTGPEFKATLRDLGVTQRALAERLGMNHRTVSEWAVGTLRVPRYVEVYLELLRYARTLEAALEDPERLQG